MILKVNSNFSQVTICFFLRLHRRHHCCHNHQNNFHQYHRHYYYYFCIIVTATSGEEGRKSIMKEIGLGKELGDCSPENVVKFIGCVTTQSKKAILCILSCLLFEINTIFFRCLFVSAKINTRIVLRNSLNKFCNKKPF